MIAREGVGENALPAIAEALEPVAAEWTEKLGVDVDFAVKTGWRIRHDQERLMVQELLHGFVDVAGERGEDTFAGIERRDPSRLPWMEAARLLMNRGAGLLLAMEAAAKTGRGRSAGTAGGRDFVNRNINKCILGAGDAFLISRGSYCWRAADRADAYEAHGGSGLYRAAVEWKFRPSGAAVCGIEKARRAWLAAKERVLAAADSRSRRRSLRSAARWIARRRTLGRIATFGLDPVVRVLARIAECIEKRTTMPADLRRDWDVFN